MVARYRSRTPATSPVSSRVIGATRPKGDAPQDQGAVVAEECVVLRLMRQHCRVSGKDLRRTDQAAERDGRFQCNALCLQQRQNIDRDDRCRGGLPLFCSYTAKEPVP